MCFTSKQNIGHWSWEPQMGQTFPESRLWLAALRLLQTGPSWGIWPRPAAILTFSFSVFFQKEKFLMWKWHSFLFNLLCIECFTIYICIRMYIYFVAGFVLAMAYHYFQLSSVLGMSQYQYQHYVVDSRHFTKPAYLPVFNVQNVPINSMHLPVVMSRRVETVTTVLKSITAPTIRRQTDDRKTDERGNGTDV